MLKVNPHNLTTLRYRIDGQVSEADILAWLYNFDEADWAVALTLLNQVSFYSETRCADVLEDGIKRIINKHGKKPIAIYPIGGIGKSGKNRFYEVFELKICRIQIIFVLLQRSPGNSSPRLCAGEESGFSFFSMS